MIPFLKNRKIRLIFQPICVRILKAPDEKVKAIVIFVCDLLHGRLCVILYGFLVKTSVFIKNKLSRKKELADDNCYNNQSKEYDITHIIEETNNLSEDKHILTKTEIAIHLLNKDSNIDFITDITGLPLDYINKLKKEAVHSQSEK